MEEKKLDSTQENKNCCKADVLEKPLLLIAYSIMFCGILISGAIVATQVLDFPFVKDRKINPVQVKTESDKKTVSLGDDPVLGDATNGKVVIVEFSDYECPFCQKFHKETFDKLVKAYVDTGKAAIVFKDFPLSIHEPMATKEAVAANCVQKLSGDKTYFSYQSLLYQNTATNGRGMSDEKMLELAKSLNVSLNDFTQCVQMNDWAEIAKDIEEGDNVGVTGTPAFIVGVLQSDGTLKDVEKLVGAQPLASFEDVIENKLSE